MTNALQAKVGDTLEWTGVLTDKDGEPVPLQGIEINTSFEGPGGATITTNNSVIDGAAATISFAQDKETTAGWVPGVYRGDVSFVSLLGTNSTRTFVVTVERSYP
jgi:hypothetical protein